MTPTTPAKLADRIDAMYREMVEIPAIKRGLVFCHTCGRSEKVNGGDCLRHGRPKCCGHTMSLDSPEERAARSALSQEDAK